MISRNLMSVLEIWHDTCRDYNGTGHAAPSAPEVYRKVTQEIYRLLHERCVSRAESFYYKLVLELEDRRQALGVSMERLSEMSGIPDRAYSKMLYPETKSGRLARWSTVEVLCQALMPDGYELRIIPTKGDKIREFGHRYQIRQITANYNRLTRREHLRELGQKGRNEERRITTVRGRKAEATQGIRHTCGTHSLAEA
jgi:hypothetical protein